MLVNKIEFIKNGFKSRLGEINIIVCFEYLDIVMCIDYELNIWGRIGLREAAVKAKKVKRQKQELFSNVLTAESGEWRGFNRPTCSTMWHPTANI